MGDVIHRKIMKNRILIMLTFTALIVIMSGYIWKYEKNNVDERLVRVQVNQLVYQLEKDDIETATIAFDYPFCVIDRKGVVHVSTINGVEINQKVDVHTLGGINRYVVPMNKEGVVSSFICVDCSKYQGKLARVQWMKHMLIQIFFWCFMIFLIFRTKKIEKADIWNPVQQLHKATKALMERRSEIKVEYDYDGEIGQLCHDFELMREEVLDSYEREKQLKEKEQVIYASISHDLKTPLATITGYVEAILYEVVQKPEDIQDYARRMLNKTIVLNKLIDDILEHSKAQLHELSIHRREVYSKDYFLEILQEYEIDARQRHYSFHYNLPENILFSIDTDRIREVIDNLIENAVKYAQKKVTIEVTFEMLHQPENMIIVSVHDNGRGIEAVDLPFIFDMFYRGNKARTLDVPGSGLGLNISKYIIEQHGGHIECDSIVGIGTTISFSLPYK